ncbi:GTPase family protein [Pseudooceanicola algae]|uniref:tRNA modification GTPase MnmE n=1 Tax=Pseudooceanicola algae TaxID=1537215 RepID=A0A418SHL3_9RHOB|nr:GTPase [Pseudooceanicola algae]QPM90298.1 tRNA modification GTPase MnmE [Pseudooceanicola algae]
MLDRILSLLLRWRVLGPAFILVLPVALLIVLGAVWLFQQGFLLIYAVVTVGLVLALAVLMRLLQWLHSRRLARAEPASTGARPQLPPDPGWSDNERRAFATAQALIADRLGDPLPLDAYQPFGLELLETIAAASTRAGKRGKTPLDFTIPEALLLIEQVSGRLRDTLRRRLPLADHVSVRLVFWAARHQARARQLFGHGYTGWRVLRAVLNPPGAVLREAGELVSSGFGRMLRDETQVILQVALFEELARSAVELYSGRLRLSDAEILHHLSEEGAYDQSRGASPDAPLRIAIAGQVSVGKSSLINALLGVEAAETDAPPTTDRATTHMTEIAGLPCVLLDLPGLDGDGSAQEAMLRDLAEADIVLWLVAASRPARDIDRRVLAAWQALYADHPVLRAPPVIALATFADRLVEGWPYPEHVMPRAAQDRIQQAVAAIASDTGLPQPIPVCLAQPDWNLTAVDRALSAQLEEGLRVQRARIRHARSVLDLRGDAVRSALSLGRNLKWFTRQMGARKATQAARDPDQ